MDCPAMEASVPPPSAMHVTGVERGVVALQADEGLAGSDDADDLHDAQQAKTFSTRIRSTVVHMIPIIPHIPTS